MIFKALFLAHAPDAEMKKHRAAIETSKFNLQVVIVRDQSQAISVAKEMVKKEGIHSILLCPGFTHRDVYEIQEAVENRAGVFVARGDSPSMRITREIMEKTGWFK